MKIYLLGFFDFELFKNRFENLPARFFTGRAFQKLKNFSSCSDFFSSTNFFLTKNTTGAFQNLKNFCNFSKFFSSKNFSLAKNSMELLNSF